MSQDEAKEVAILNGPTGAAHPVAKQTSPPSTAFGERALNGASTPPSARRPERMQSGKAKRELNHARSQSRHHHQQQELKTVGEYALHHLFNAFVGQADQKINQCITNPELPEPRVELICGPGVDPSFDQLISALGHIARQKPKPLIDTLMFWRKAKSEAATNARAELAQLYQRGVTPPTNGLLPRRNTEGIQANGDTHTSHAAKPSLQSSISARETAVAQAERRSTVSIYLLCRVLIEIIGQSSLACITPEMADRLEDIIYTQLTAADPASLDGSPLRHANWVIFSQLLGVMSEINFDHVSDRFVKDLEKMQHHLGVKGLANREVEARAVLIVKGMRHLRVKFYPEDAWERSCEFMQSLAKLFANVHGQPVKYSYCQLFRELLLPIAAKATSELNVPQWKAAIDTIRARLLLMMAKPKHWLEAFPLMAVLLCVSPVDVFASQWQQLVLPLQSRLKERTTRAVALRGICRLVWTYLYRTSDTQNGTVKKLDEIVRLVFQPGKKSYLSTETAIAEPIIQLIRIIGFSHQDFCFRTIIFPLLNSEQFASGKDLKVENLEPERMVIGIRAFLAIMADLEKGEQPPFPVTFDHDPYIDATEIMSLPASPRPVVQPSPRAITIKEERLSRPVTTAGFPEITKEYYIRFCKVLGEITIICDNAFGGQAVLDEKFSAQTPKTPMADAFSFARRDDNYGPADAKQGFYDLLHVAVQALPRCLSPHIPFNSLINLLCTGTAHVHRNIAASSAQSLKSIARQSHAQQVTIGFARFIFNYDDRYATMSDGGMLGAGHIENTLRLYVELLHIWIEEIRQKTKKATADPSEDGISGSRGAQLDLSGVWAHVDEIESHGLFFLCSPSRRVRSFAVTVLRLVTEFDTALGKDSTRVIRIMEGSPQKVMDVNDEKLSLAERSRLQRGMRKSNLQSTLVELCSSDVAYDSTLWFKIFPNLIRLSFEVCPFAVTLTRDIVCARLSQMQRTLVALTEGTRTIPYTSLESAQSRVVGRLASTAPELVVEQWKLYLIFACTTLTNAGSQQQNPSQTGQQHIRNPSKSSQRSQSKVQSAGDLFARVIPFLAAESPAIREAVAVGLGSINMNLYRTLLESMQNAVSTCSDEAKVRLTMHQRSASSPRRNPHTDHLRTEITHVYKLTSHFLQSAEAYNDEWILNNLVNYTKDLRLFLNDAEIQTEWSFHKLRTHYCGLVEELFEGINKTKDPIRWMPFQARKAAFALMEDWCGYSPNQSQIRQREDTMRKSILDREHDLGNKEIRTAAMEIEKRNLRTAALSAMAALCGGPVSITTDSKVNLQFDVRRMLSWIDTIFETASDKTHAIGRRALKNLILHNRQHPYLLARSIEKCYVAKSPKALESYFEVVTQLLTERDDFVLPFWKVLGAGLYTLGNESNVLRMKSARLLRTVEERLERSSKLQDLDISISDKTIAVYKLAQFEVSRRLANQHSELAFHVFSEFSLHFRDLKPDHQRNMVAAMLPWIQTINLQLDPNGGPTANSYMVLVNLFEITVRCGTALHNEIQALWQALATGPHAGNVQLILNFIISLCLDKREQNFVDYVKQIVVYMSSTPAGLKVVEFLLLQITPKAMVTEKREPTLIPQDAAALPYLADLGQVLPTSNKQTGFSMGQLCLVLLVDLMVPPLQLAREQIPLLLQVVLVLWDHYTPLVQDQAREMLVHLIHELVISRIENDSTTPDKRSIEDFIESVRRNDPKVVWGYEENNGDREDDLGPRVPAAMAYVADEVLKIFGLMYPGFREDWGKMILHWATSCPVRHLACRSFQLFRCVSSTLDQPMLADMLARLSNTISDDEGDIQTFSMEILTTLKTIIQSLSSQDIMQYPQLFWTTCACLDTIHEREFMESLDMLDKLLDKVNIGDPTVVKVLKDCQPQKWDGGFAGLAELIYKGVRSSICLNRSLKLLERLVALPPNELTGDNSRLLFVVLANLPRFLRSFDEDVRDPLTLSSAMTLAAVAENQNCDHIARALNGFANFRYRADKDFLAQMVSAIRTSFLPDLEYKCLVFLLSLLTNKLPWFKIKTMQLLCVIVPDIDLRKPEIAAKGPDLISPLLRLLQTEFCPQALQVLDNIMTMSGAPTPLDRHHLRMSMAGAHSSRAFRKEYERTQSLYGIPEETGWSIPMPADQSQSTRNNVHAVFYTCVTSEAVNTAEVATPKIEFRQEEEYHGYFPDYRTATMTSEEVRGDAHIGELVSQLDSLDDFFDDETMVDNNSMPSLPTSPGLSRFTSTNGVSDARENVYDQQTAPILHKSLTRNASVTSFQTGFADMRYSRDPGIMTPTAFTAPAIPPVPTVPTLVAALAQPRPGLHSRSVTSPPTVVQRTPPGSEFRLDENDESISDDELTTSRASANDKPSTFDRFTQGTRSGWRSATRRLTGGGGDARDKERTREAIRAQTQQSPQVPKVPDVYLQNVPNPQSADP
ncbi:Cell morphogenesis protein PAG1 [Coniosporium apollinis]|uniref:Cell morphogenesis protein PAG1 n=1 Tax=Coniosporium apollinis TaxID=61459 RepID=A0ABQ9P5K7_9PEZI|nr:Cell morphogenesis protein PAG1 [Coniosporium apollinis]